MNPIQPILKAYREGNPALLLSGRSLYDFVTDDGRLRPLLEFLRRVLFREFRMVFINYSLANGLNWFESWIPDESDREMIRGFLRQHHLLEIPQTTSEVVSVVRGVASLSRTDTRKLKWKDGRQMHFAVCFEFTEHLAPGSLTNGTQTDGQLIVTELVHLTSQSLALRDSGNLILFHSPSGDVAELVCGGLKHVRLPQPDKEEKQEFVEAAMELYTEAKFEEGLTTDAVVALTVNTPNRGLEGLLRASHRGQRILTAKEIGEQKNSDVINLSEETLSPLDTGETTNLRLVGRNIEKPQSIMLALADRLLRGSPLMPANVLLGGCAGVGKTMLAKLVAERAKVPAYQMHSPKAGIVGMTERRAHLQQQVLKEWAPNVAFCDEITEAMPLERGEFNGDSGASRAVTAEILSALADESRRGKSLLIGATNRVFAMGAAMRSRWVIVPCLFPLAQDFPQIVVAVAKRIAPASSLDENDLQVAEAARIFYQKGASPRHVFSALTNTLSDSDKDFFEPGDVLLAADDLCATTDFHSAVYADLWAIKCCTSRSFLPWSDSPENYPFPDYLKDVVNPQTGDIIEQTLSAKIKEYEPYANI